MSRCREHGLRITPQRTTVYEHLLRSRDHPTAEQLYRRARKRLPNISLDTVNRTLLTFAEIGLIHVVEGFGSSRRYDPDLTEHHHAHCVKCGTIIDFHNSEFDDLVIPTYLRRQFRITGKKVVVSGICEKCRGNS